MIRSSLIVSALSLSACATAAPCVNDVTHAPATHAKAAPQPGSSTGTVRALDDATKRVAPNGKATAWLLAQGDNAFLGKLEMAPGAQVPEHRDPTEEYIHVLSGHGTLTLDGTAHEVGPGSTIYMPAGAAVSFVNGDEPLVGIQVFAGPEPAAKYDAWQ